MHARSTDLTMVSVMTHISMESHGVFCSISWCTRLLQDFSYGELPISALKDLVQRMRHMSKICGEDYAPDV